jgi:hypothetical protein
MRAGWGTVIGLAAAFAISSPASADTYCVHRAGCNAAHTKPTIQDAMDAVTSDRRGGVILVGAGTFNEEATYTGPVPVSLIGAGESVTTIATSSIGAVLDCDTAARMTVENLTIRQGMGGGESDGVSSSCPFTASNIDVNTEFAPQAVGIVVTRGDFSLSRSIVRASEVGPETYAIEALGGASLTITDSQIIGEYGIYAFAEGGVPTVVAHRLQITASGTPAAGVWAQSARVSIDDSLIEVTAGAVALSADSFSGDSALTARQLTMIGDGSAPAIQTESNSGHAGTRVSVSVRDSLMRGSTGSSPGFAKPYCAAAVGETVTVSIDYSDFKFPTGPVCLSPRTAHYIQGSHNLNDINPLFVSPGAMDYQLRAASPVRDRDPLALASWESTTDLAGQTRIRGFARDLGAYEFQPPPPGARTRGTSHVTRRGATVHGTLTTYAAGTEWWFVYGLTSHYGHRTRMSGPVSAASPLGVELRLTGLQRGHTYHYRLVASNGVVARGSDRTFRTRR